VNSKKNPERMHNSALTVIWVKRQKDRENGQKKRRFVQYGKVDNDSKT
jgi:hypothetical protein